MTDETVEQKFERQTKAQYEALGRYVQAFELMVFSIRTRLVSLLSNDALYQERISLVLDNRAMTAGPLWEAMCHVALATAEQDSWISANSRKVIVDLLSYLSTKIQKELRRRNDVLHAAWLVGFTSKGQEDFEEMLHTKFNPSNKGLRLTDLPKSPKEFETVCTEIKDLTRLIDRLGLVFAPRSVSRPADFLFQKVGAVWKPKND